MILNQIQELIKQNNTLRDEFIKSFYPDSESIIFNNIKLHHKMDFSFFSDDKIILIHTILHTLHSNKTYDSNKVQILHSIVLKEYEKRKIEHRKFDNLDNI